MVLISCDIINIGQGYKHLCLRYAQLLKLLAQSLYGYMNSLYVSELFSVWNVGWILPDGSHQ